MTDPRRGSGAGASHGRRSMRRRAALAAALTLTGSAVVALAPAASAADALQCTTPAFQDAGRYSVQDFDGNAYSDLAVGIPHIGYLGGQTDVGAVDVHYARHATPDQRINEGYFSTSATPQSHDEFGMSVAETHLYGGYQSCVDLVIGAPGVDSGRGAVTIAAGTNSGYERSRSVRLTGQQAGERFGSAVAADDSNVWIGAPDRTVDGRRGAGAVYHYVADSSGTLSLTQIVTEDSAGVPGNAETEDHFGQVLAASPAGNLVVGEPDEDVGTKVDAGAVTILTSTSSGTVGNALKVWQDSPGVYGTSEAGDHFGASVSYDGTTLAVGVPGEDDGTIRDAGMAQLFHAVTGTDTPLSAITPLSTVTQGTPTIPSASEPGDQFGAAVVVADHDRLFIGAPGESLGRFTATGDVVRTNFNTSTGKVTAFGHVIRLGGAGPDNLPGPLQSGAHVGNGLSRFAASNDGPSYTGGESVVVAVPAFDDYPDVNSGEVWVSSNGDGVTVAGAGVYENSADEAADQHYGVPASAVSNGGVAGV